LSHLKYGENRKTVVSKDTAVFLLSEILYRKLLLCGVMQSRIALAILAKQSAGFAFCSFIGDCCCVE